MKCTRCHYFRMMSSKHVEVEDVGLGFVEYRIIATRECPKCGMLELVMLPSFHQKAKELK